MEGFRLSDYRRISAGVIVSLVSWLLLPLAVALTIAYIAPLLGAGVTVGAILSGTGGPAGEAAVQLLHYFGALEEAIRVLATLAIITGLSGAEAASARFRSARAWFVARIVIDVVFSLADALLLALSTRGIGVDLSDAAATLLRVASTAADFISVLVIGYAAHRALLLGYADVLRRLGDDAQAAKAESLCRVLTLVCLALFIAAVPVGMLFLLRPESHSSALLIPLVLLLAVLLMRTGVQFALILRSRAVARTISEVSV